MAFVLTAASICTIFGDSNTAGSPGVLDGLPRGGLLAAIKAEFVPGPVARAYAPSSGVKPAPAAYPRFYPPNGVSGRAIGDVSADIMAIIGAGSTHAIGILGLNEAQRIAGAALTLGQVNTQMRESLDDLRTGGVESVLWVGPFAAGEKSPRPHIGNSYDTHLISVDDLLAEILGEYDGDFGTYAYCSLASLFDVQEPILNVGNDVIGPFTSDGVHFDDAKPTTRALVIAAILAQIGTA